MYTSYIGKKFLRIYRSEYDKPDDYSAQQFFDEVLFPLFFNDEKHFLNVANSSFFQAVSNDLLNQGKTIHQIKQERFHENVKVGASLTTLVGYAAQGLKAGTSGQVSSLKIDIDSEEMYASWIGSGLTIAMGGGYSILVDDYNIIKGLFIGWNYYRKFLSQIPNLKGNQIDVWNSHWITHYLSKSFDIDDPLDGFVIPSPESCKADKWKKLGFIEFSTNNWAKVIFAFAKKYPNTQLIVNCFKFSDTNQTLGIIPLYLPEIKRMYELRDKIFINKEESTLSDNDIDKLETFFRFNEACKLGTIGLKSIEPKGLRDFINKGSTDFAQGKDFKFTDENSYISYQLYKLWIIAMLNKTELLKLASDVARVLLAHEQKDLKENRGRKDKDQESSKIRDAKTIKEFIENLTGLLEKSSYNADILKEVVEQVVKMPTDSFPLFATLIRFEYTYQNSKTNQ
jgi:hypothetical protein